MLYKCCFVVFIYNVCINSIIYLNVVCIIVCYLFFFCDGCFILLKSNFKDVYSMVMLVIFLIFLLMLKSKEVNFLKFIVNIIDMLSYV